MGYTLKQLICDLISEKNDNRLSSENTSKILSNINDSFNDACKSINYQYSSKYVLPLVYLYAKAIEMGDKSIDWKEVLKWDFVKNDLFLLDFLTKNYSSDLWSRPLKEVASDYDPKQLYLTFFLNTVDTSDDLDQMVCKILDIQKSDSILDLSDKHKGQFLGTHDLYFTIQKDNVKIALDHLWADFDERVGYEDQIIKTDVFDIEGIKSKSAISGFDKIFPVLFSNKYLRDVTGAEKLIAEIAEKNPDIMNVTSSTWLYAINTAKLLSETGRGIIYASRGSLWNKKDTVLRKYLIDMRMIEAVINIQMSDYNINNEEGPAALVVLSHGNSTIKFIDRNLKMNLEGDRKFPELTKKKTLEEVDLEIINMLKNGNENCSYYIEVSYDDLENFDYSFNINRYTHSDDLINNGVPFAKVIKSIRRGITLKPADISSNQSFIKTSYMYLMSSQIEDGMIDSNLMYLKNIDPKQQKYCLKNKNMVITKNGSPHKVAVAVLDKDELILCADNCYILELDTKQIDPYYLQSYLMSDKGVNALERITTGNTVKTIGVTDLKEMLIPCPSLEDQYSTSERFKHLLRKIRDEKRHLSDQRNKLSEVFFRGE